MTVPFGKYKGKSVQWVFNNDKNYYDWLTSIETFGKFNEEINKFIETKEKQKKKQLKKYLVEIDKLMQESKKVYRQDIHAVGEAFIIDKIHVEDICNSQFCIYTWGNESLWLTKDEYDVFYNILHPAWLKYGKLYVERGLY